MICPVGWDYPNSFGDLSLSEGVGVSLKEINFFQKNLLEEIYMTVKLTIFLCRECCCINGW
jgi:hypothetical protein